MGEVEYTKLHGQEDGSDCREWRLEGGHGETIRVCAGGNWMWVKPNYVNILVYTSML